MAEPITMMERHMRLPYTLTVGTLQSRFMKAIRDEKKIYGTRCTRCKRVFVPPYIACALCWANTEGWVEVADRGVVKSFTVSRVPFYGLNLEVPFVLPQVLLDGADTSTIHLLQEVEVEDVRIGMRVEAVWTEEPRKGLLADDILYFRPTGEPDVPVEALFEERL